MGRTHTCLEQGHSRQNEWQEQKEAERRPELQEGREDSEGWFGMGLRSGQGLAM